jgi:hypothetical protein
LGDLCWEEEDQGGPPIQQPEWDESGVGLAQAHPAHSLLSLPIALPTVSPLLGSIRPGTSSLEEDHWSATSGNRGRQFHLH